MTSLIGKIHSLSRLRWALVGFVLSLGAPALVLVYYSLSELKWETYHQQRTLAIELTDRINFKIYHWIQVEEQRAYSDYQFLVVSGNPAANYFQPSPLANPASIENLPGTIGFFQVDSDGHFSSPSLPSTLAEAEVYGITEEEFELRNHVRERMLQILVENSLLPDQRDMQNSSSRQLAKELVSVPPSGRSTVDSALLSQNVSAQSSSRVNNNRVNSIESTNRQSAVTNGGDQYLNSGQTQAFDNLSQQKAIEDSAIEEKRLLQELDLDSKLQEAVEKKKSRSAQNSSASYSRPAPRKEQTILPRPLRPIENGESSERAVDSATVAEVETETDNEPPPALSDNALLVEPSSRYSNPNVTMFESEIDPFEFSLLDSGHFVFFRKVWREGERTIQGLLLEPQEFLQGTIGREYRETLLSSVVDLVVAHRANLMSIFQGEDTFTRDLSEQGISGELLYHTRLAPPFNDIELLYSMNEIPSGPGAQVVQWAAIVMALVLSLGTFLIYRLGLRQMRLAQQQQDFVSAVSHELKTPLTSIRMYGEMLREGWADDNKKRQYYDYIYDESERLSRLIANVLQLAKMNRKEFDLNLKSVNVSELVDNFRSKLGSQVESNGFTLEIKMDKQLETEQVLIDNDGFLQVVINLVDNALKFSAKSEIKKIELSIDKVGEQEMRFAIRDYGPGIDKQHFKKIFNLFYRAEDELTRETVGTGIGLALVSQLLRSMNGRIEVHNREPGAEFYVFLNTAE